MEQIVIPPGACIQNANSVRSSMWVGMLKFSGKSRDRISKWKRPFAILVLALFYIFSEARRCFALDCSRVRRALREKNAPLISHSSRSSWMIWCSTVQLNCEAKENSRTTPWRALTRLVQEIPRIELMQQFTFCFWKHVFALRTLGSPETKRWFLYWMSILKQKSKFFATVKSNAFFDDNKTFSGFH